MTKTLTLTALKAALDNGTAQEMFPVGTFIDDTWTDIATVKTYSAPLIIVHYGEFETVTENEETEKRLGAVLLREDTLPGKWRFGNCDHLRRNGSYWESTAASAMTNRYAEGCSDELGKLAVRIMLKDNGAAMAVKHFLPSADELAIIVNDEQTLNSEAVWEYFRDTPVNVYDNCDCEKLACSSPYYTRSVCKDGYLSGSVWAVNTCGNPVLVHPEYTVSFRPACVIA